MDYVETFGNLKPNYKYSRKTPHKAVLLLAVIDLFESRYLTDNVIHYDRTLRQTYMRVWNRVVPNERTLVADASMPFWYLQQEDFWHVVPKRGREDLVSYMYDEQVRPSEQMLMDDLDYVELDEDLYFLMTIQSGRVSLRKALLENYTLFSEYTIEAMAESKDSFDEEFSSAYSIYKDVLESSKESPSQQIVVADSDLSRSFLALEEDVRYVFCIEYYTFLKKQRSERAMMLSICPTVESLYDKIVHNSFSKEELSPSVTSMLSGFLSNLKIAMLGEDGSMELIDNISKIVGALKDQTCSDSLSDKEIDAYLQSYEEEDAKAAEARLIAAKEDIYTEENADSQQNNSAQEEETPLDFYVENTTRQGVIFNKEGKLMFSVAGKLKIFHGKAYRFNYKSMCFTVKDMIQVDGQWTKGTKQLVAYSETDLYETLDKSQFIDQIEDFVEGSTIKDNTICVDGKWYNFDGDFICEADNLDNYPDADSDVPEASLGKNEFEPKGKLKKIKDIAKSSFDYLWMMAIIDIMGETNQPSSITYDNLGCMMIANAWRLLAEEPNLQKTESSLVECINFLIEESKDNMDEPLDWSSSKDSIFEAIRDYPMAGPFEDAVDELLEEAPFNVLKAWIKSENNGDIMMHSVNFNFACLYAVYPNGVDPHIEINPKWKRYLRSEYNNLIDYYGRLYIESLKSE